MQSCTICPVLAHGTVAIFPVRWYSRKLMNVVRMRMFTAVFFADMTLRKPRIGCTDPPIARTSETVAMIDRGVAQTMKQSATAMSRYLTNFWNGCAPSTRPIPSQREELAEENSVAIETHR